MRAFAEAWPEAEFGQQAAAQLPWFHLCTLLDKLGTRAERDWYLAKAVQDGWSRSVQVMQIETQARERTGRAITNFDARLPAPQSDLAREARKEPSSPPNSTSQTWPRMVEVIGATMTVDSTRLPNDGS